MVQAFFFLGGGGWGVGGMPKNVSDYVQNTLDYVGKFEQADWNNAAGRTRSTSKSYPQFQHFNRMNNILANFAICWIFQ